MAHILLTGARGGIGAATAQALKAAGHTVVALDRDHADMRDRSALEALAQRPDVQLVDWIVCAHGFISAETDLSKQTAEEIENTFSLNSTSLVHLASLFLERLPAGGGMVFISSTAALSPNGRYAAYSASKAAVNAFTQALARNNPDKKFYAVAPGPTDTAMREKIGGDRAAAQAPEVVAHLIARLIAGSEFASGDIIAIRDGIISKAGGLTI